MMRTAPIRSALSLALLAVVMHLGMQTAEATQFFIDEFSIVKNGSPFFDDTFNGTAPPTGPNFVGTDIPASYFVQGTFSNAGNKVLMDTADGQVLPSGITGLPLSFLQALLLTNIDPLNTVNGLKSNHTFSVTGIFNLTVPGLGEAYGIRLADYTDTDVGDDVLDLRVDHTSATPRVTFFDFNLITHTPVVLGSVVLDPGHTGIALSLTKPDAGSPDIHGSFAYIDGGIMGPTFSFANTGNAFTDENFTRAAFIAFQPASVPEPSSLLLLTCSLVGFGAIAWRRRRHK